MTRFLVLSLFLSVSAFGQANEEQQCRMKCGQAMSACITPCMGSNPKDAAKPENRDKVQSCVKTCSAEQKPCLNDCKKKAKGK